MDVLMRSHPLAGTRPMFLITMRPAAFQPVKRILFVAGLIAACPIFGNGADSALSPDGKTPNVARRSLPGLIASPKELPGGVKWQLLTMRPRGDMTCFDLTADGKWAAFADEAVVRVYETKGFVLRHILVGHRDRVRAVSWSPDGTRIATGSADKTARIWNADGALVAELQGHSDAVKAVAWSRDGKRLATCGQDATVRLWNADGSAGPVIRGGDAPFNCVAFNRDGTRLVAGDDDRLVRIWKTDGTLVARCEGHRGSILSVDWSPDGKRVASACAGFVPEGEQGRAVAAVRIWDENGRFIQSLDGYTGPIDSVRFSPDGSKIATSSTDFTTREWSIDGKLLGSVRGEKEGVIRWAPDNTRVYVACSRRVYSVDSVADQSTLSRGLDEDVFNERARQTGLVIERSLWLQRALWSPGGKTFATLGYDSRLRLFDAAGRNLWTADAGRDRHYDMDLCWRPDGKELIVTGSEKETPVFSDTGKQLRQITIDRQPFRLVQWSPDGKSILGSDFTGAAFLISTDGKPGRVFQGHRQRIESLAWNPNGKQFATSSIDATVRIWNVDGTSVKTLEGLAGDVDSVAWSPDGQWISAGMDDGSWRLWKADGTEGPTFNGHRESVMSIAFRRDGKRVTTASWDGTLRIWNSTGGEAICVLEGHSAPVASVSWSPDGKRVLSASRDNSARIWNAETGRCEALVLTLTDGTTATFSATGELLDGRPASVEKDIRCLIERPNGTVELLSWSQFQKIAKQGTDR